jgi:ubiquinone/menaquinone biosynthesis C-methylase UbiE
MEIDLLKSYPKLKRNTNDRASSKTDNDQIIARQFGQDFFDGDRRHGYGGYYYDKKYWSPVVPDFMNFYKLNSQSKVLDIGCGKGFFLYDLVNLIPGISISGVDISSYAINHSLSSVRPFLKVCDAKNLPYDDNYFDLVVSINTIHNLDKSACESAVREIERVSKGDSYITVDAFRTEEEELRMEEWNLTAKTFMHVDEWKKFFNCAGYTGDYFWFIP